MAVLTNLPRDLTLEEIEERWDIIDRRTKIHKTGFTELIAYCKNSGYFMVNGAYYKKIVGVAIGSCLSPTTATRVMDTLSDAVLPKLEFTCRLAK